MSKKKSFRARMMTRERVPRYWKTPEGNIQVLCPFCEPPHPIYPDKKTGCGTILKVTAAQDVYPARTIAKAEVKCARCGKSGGEMVAYGRGFTHVENCNPERKLLVVEPHYSKFAKRVYNMPAWLKRFMQRLTGPAIEVNEVDEAGNETGKVLGYYFGVPIGRANSKGKHPPAGAG